MLGRRLPLGLLLAALACSSDPGEPPETAVTLRASAAGPLSGFAGSRLLGVPIVQVVDAAGDPVTNVTVNLQLQSGGGAGFRLPEGRAASGPDGIVRADVVLGAAGDAAIRVTSARASEDLVVPVVADAAPSLATVAPESFGAGDELVLTGTGFPSSMAGTRVEVGGVAATVLETTATTMRVRAPACVAPGPAAVVVRIGDVSTNALNATAEGGASAPLQPYEGVIVPASRSADCLTLLGGGAEYLVVPQFATHEDVPSSIASQRPAYLLGAAVTDAPVASLARPEPGTPGTLQQRFDLALRRREHALAPFAAASGAHPDVGAVPLAALELNSTRAFRVLDDLDSSDSFTSVTGRLKFIGDNVLVYVDELSPAGGFTDPQFDALGRLFDRKLHRVAVNAFGSTSDIDRNGHVVVLMTPVVNRLTEAATCQQFGYVTGFFYGLDLTPTRENSNKGEIFYSIVPDPAGATGSCSHSVAEVNRMVPSTFIHELQHMISWNQHVLVRGARDEELWLNEGLSHIAEELASLEYENDPTQPRSTASQIFPDSSQGFIVSNVGNAYEYLERPTDVSITLFRDFGSLEERGASWLFLRWLADQKGNGVLRRLVETSLTGVDNVEDKAGESFGRLFGDFGITVYADRLSDTRRAQLPDRYRFTSRDFRRIFQRFHDLDPERLDYPTPHPITPRTLLAGTNDVRSMLPGAMTWYLLSTSAASPAVSVRFQPNGTGSFTDALGAQVGILRLPSP